MKTCQALWFLADEIEEAGAGFPRVHADGRADASPPLA